MTSKYAFKTPPFDHQRQALLRGWNRPSFAYLMEMGTGKSKVTVDNAGILFQQGLIDRALVIAPKNSYDDWIDKHFPRDFPYEYRTHLWRGWKTVTEKSNFGFMMQSGSFKLMSVNVEAFQNDNSDSHGVVRAFLEAGPSIAVVDESTVIKNNSAKRTNNVIHHGRLASYRRILTGSPITQSPLDAYSQFDFLDEGLLKYRNFFAFRSRYALMKKRDPKARHSAQFPVAWRNLQELRDNVKANSFRVLKKDCLDLPDKTWVMRHVDMNEAQTEAYISMRTTGTVVIGDKFCTAEEAMTRVLRCHQITCGFLPMNDGTVIELSNSKLEELFQIADETASQIVIWSRFKYDIARIYTEFQKHFGKDSIVQSHGDMPKEQRIVSRKIFQHGQARFFVTNPQTSARAINELVVADTAVYYSNDWSLDLRLQSEDRIHRLGQSSDKCLYIDLATRGTVDIKIVQALRDNIDVATTINGDNYREWLI